MPVGTSTFIRDSVLFIRDLLRTGVTDPISATRSSSSQFVMTSYPRRPTEYPLISIQLRGAATAFVGGMQSEAMMPKLRYEIRVWARNHKEKDQISEDVIDTLRDEMLTASTGTVAYGLHDYLLRSLTPLDESGENGPVSNILEVEYLLILS